MTKKIKYYRRTQVDGTQEVIPVELSKEEDIDKLNNALVRNNIEQIIFNNDIILDFFDKSPNVFIIKGAIIDGTYIFPTFLGIHVLVPHSLGTSPSLNYSNIEELQFYTNKDSQELIRMTNTGKIIGNLTEEEEQSVKRTLYKIINGEE